MPSGAVGRNEPCPCGSGKKYKKCCLGKEPARLASETAPPTHWEDLSFSERAQIAAEVQRLDDLSNGAIDAIHARRYADAERLCAELLREYPQMIDGPDRLGMLREAQGRFAEAAEQYSKALAIIEAEPDGHAPELAEFFRERRDEAYARARKQV